MAYIATDPSSSYSNLTWTIDSTGAAPWNATITNSTNVGEFYIVTADSAYDSAGFMSGNQTTNVTGAVTSGFATFGSQVVFIDNGTYEAQFWAQTTDETNVWFLKWNSAGSSQTDSTPVAIKITAPSN